MVLFISSHDHYGIHRISKLTHNALNIEKISFYKDTIQCILFNQTTVVSGLLLYRPIISQNKLCHLKQSINTFVLVTICQKPKQSCGLIYRIRRHYNRILCSHDKLVLTLQTCMSIQICSSINHMMQQKFVEIDIDNKHEIVSIIVKVFPGQLLPGKYLSYIMAVSLLMEEIGVPGENH